MTSHKQLLAIFAHPDDETFGAGSTLAHYASLGVKVSLICATRGEVGEILNGVEATRETLGAVREQELRNALKVLGVGSLSLLGYRDSGMAGTDDNKNPQAFINAPESEVLEQIVDIMRQKQPQVVVTMDLNGGYGHPDHIYAAKMATKAFRKSGDSGYTTSSRVQPWSPSRLYYHTFPRSIMVKWMEAERQSNPTSDMANIDPGRMGTADEDITTILDVSAQSEKRILASAQHRSQASPFGTMPQEAIKAFISKDYFQRVVPGWKGGPTETDLFQGI